MNTHLQVKEDQLSGVPLKEKINDSFEKETSENNLVMSKFEL